MIFRTITDDITGANKSIGLFGKSLNDFKEVINFFKQNGFVNTFFNTPLINIDTDAIDDYNTAIRAGKTFEDALATARRTTNAETVALIESSRGAEIQTERVTAAQKASTIAAKAHSAALKAASIAGNMILFAAITKGIQLVVKGFDNWIHRVEKANEAMQDAVSEYESAKSSLENVNSELKERNKQLDELLAKDKLTYAEQGQLEELQAITQELLLQQDIEEKRAANASKEAADKAVDAYKKQYGRYDNTEDDLQEKLSYEIFPIPEDADDVLGMIAAYIRAQELLKQSQKKFDDAIKNGEDTTWLEDNVQFNIDMVDDYRQALDENISDLHEKRLALEDEYNKAIEKRESEAEPLTSSEKEVIKTYESIYDVMRMVYEYTDKHTWKSMQIESVFDTEGIEKTKEELIKMVKAGEFDESTLQSYPKLSEALKQNKVSASELRNELEALAEAEDNVQSSTSNNKSDIFSSLSESQSTAIKSYQDTLSSITDIFKNFRQADTTDLMSTFSDYDWSAYLSGAEDLDTALRKIATQSLQAVIDQMEGLEGCEPILDELKQKFNDTFNFDFDLSENLAAYNELTALLERVRKGGELNKKEIAGLINRYPELASAIQDTTEGYRLEESAVVSLTNKYVESVNTGIAAQVRTTESVIEATSARIQSYRDEYGAYAKILDMYAAGNDYRNGSYNADRQGELLKYGTSDFDRVIAEEEKALEEFRQKLSFKTKIETSDSSSGSGSSSSSSTPSTSDFSDPIDWAAQSLDVLERRVSAAQTALDNTKGYQAQIKAINKLIKEQEKLASGYDEAQKVYQTKYNTALSTGVIADQGLSDAVRKQIEGGKTFRIEDFIDKNVASGDTGIREQLHDAVTDAVSWYNKANDAGDNAVKIRFQLQENEISKLEAVRDNISGKIDIINAKLENTGIGDKTRSSLYDKLYKWTARQYESEIDIARAAGDVNKAKQLEIELQNELNSIADKQADIKISRLENDMALLENQKSQLDNEIEIIKAKGYTVSETIYSELVRKEKANQEDLVSKRAILLDSLNAGISDGTIQKYSEKWYKMSQDIDDVTSALSRSNLSIIEFQNSIRSLQWDAFDNTLENIHRIIDESDFLIKLLSYGDLHNKDGSFTNAGLAALGQHAVNYNTYLMESKKYAGELADIQAQLAGDPASQDLISRERELQDAQWASVLSAQSEKQSMIELAREGIQVQIDAMKELIEQKKEMLSAEKSLYEYQKSVASKTANIADIQKQLSAYEQDQSEEGRQKAQSLRKQLADSREDLEDTRYGQWLQEQQSLLDQLMDEYETLQNEMTNNTDALLADLLGTIDANSGTIEKTVSDAASKASASLFSKTDEIWNRYNAARTETTTAVDKAAEASNRTADAANEKGEALNTGLSYVLENLDPKNENLILSINGMVSATSQDMISHIDHLGATITGALSRLELKISTPAAQESGAASTDSGSTNIPEASASALRASAPSVPQIGQKINGVSGKWYSDSSGAAPSGSADKYNPDYFIIDRIVSGQKYPYHIQSYINGKAIGGNGWVKASQIGYRNGLKNALKNHLAWTQEGGNELIYRAKDGAMLTPIGQNDSVFTRKMTDNLWNLAQIDWKYAPAASNMPSFKGTSGNVTNDISMNITLPNVTNYNEFKKELIRDKNFEKAIQAMTIDQIAGQSGLSKYRYLK